MKSSENADKNKIEESQINLEESTRDKYSTTKKFFKHQFFRMMIMVMVFLLLLIGRALTQFNVTIKARITDSRRRSSKSSRSSS